MDSGKLDVKPLITHRVPLVRAPHALELMERKAEEVMKVVLLPRT